MKIGKAKTNFFGMNKPRQGIGRRVLSWPLTSLVFFVFSMVLAAPAEGATVRDEFDAISYGGDNGAANWAGDWVEFGEDAMNRITWVCTTSCGPIFVTG